MKVLSQIAVINDLLIKVSLSLSKYDLNVHVNAEKFSISTNYNY